MIIAMRNTARHESTPEVLHQFTVRHVDVSTRQLQYTVLHANILGLDPGLDREIESIEILTEAGPVSLPYIDQITEEIDPPLGPGRVLTARYCPTAAKEPQNPKNTWKSVQLAKMLQNLLKFNSHP